MDAIGGSAAGVYVANEVRVGSLYRAVPPELFASRVRRLFFELALDVLQRDPEEVAFIDDRPGNCAAAEALGIHAIQYHDETQCSQALERLGLGSGVRT